MSFGIPVRNGLGVGLLASTFLSTRRGRVIPTPALALDFLTGSLDGRVTFTRSTTATFVGSNGLIQNSPQSRNLLTWTQEFDNAVWPKTATTVTIDTTAAPDGTPTADKAIATAVAGYKGLARNLTITAAVSHVFSIYVKAAEYSLFRVADGASGRFFVSFDVSNGTVVAGSTGGVQFTSASITPAGNGWYRCIVVFAATAASYSISFSGYPAGATLDLFGVQFTGNGTSGIFIWGAQLEQASTASDYTRNAGGLFPPRFDYDPITLAPLGLLVEEARTNLMLQSEDFTVTWAPVSATVTTNTTVAPDGATTGDTVTASTTASYVSQAVVFTGDGNKSYSLFVKAGTATVTRLVLRDTTAAINRGGVNLTWTAGVPAGVATEGTLQGIDAYPNGWYRVRMLALGVVAANTNQFRFSPDTAVGTNNTIFWGAQTENGAFATSYIPTVASQVTRTADQATMTGTNFSSWYNASEGTFVSSFDVIGVNTATVRRHVWNGSDAGNQRLSLRALDTATNAPIAAIGTGTAVASLNGTALLVNTPTNIAVAYGSNMALSQNGATPATDASAASVSISSLDIGCNLAATLFLNGHIRTLTFYNTRLTDSQLQMLTV